MKLLVHPALVWLTATRLFQLEALPAAVAVMEASLPTAATAFVLVQQHEVHVERVSSVVCTSTAASVVTVSTLPAFLGSP